MRKENKFIVDLKRPFCRTPIKPVQKHKNEAKYERNPKHRAKTFSDSMERA
jgi:hypothetical protein